MGPNPHIRLYSPEDLAATKTDPWMATLLANCRTLSKDMLIARQTGMACARYDVVTGGDVETIYAANDECALRFARAQYNEIEEIEQITTTVRRRAIDIHPERGPFA